MTFTLTNRTVINPGVDASGPLCAELINNVKDGFPGRLFEHKCVKSVIMAHGGTGSCLCNTEGNGCTTGVPRASQSLSLRRFSSVYPILLSFSQLRQEHSAQRSPSFFTALCAEASLSPPTQASSQA